MKRSQKVVTYKTNMDNAYYNKRIHSPNVTLPRDIAAHVHSPARALVNEWSRDVNSKL